VALWIPLDMSIVRLGKAEEIRRNVRAKRVDRTGLWIVESAGAQPGGFGPAACLVRQQLTPESYLTPAGTVTMTLRVSVVGRPLVLRTILKVAGPLAAALLGTAAVLGFEWSSVKWTMLSSWSET